MEVFRFEQLNILFGAFTLITLKLAMYLFYKQILLVKQESCRQINSEIMFSKDMNDLF